MKGLAPAFTAVLTLGYAACLAGRPYVDTEGVVLVLPALGISTVFAARSIRFGSGFGAWSFLVIFIIGALTDRSCACGAPVRPQHFPTLIIALFLGFLGVYLASRNPPPIRIIRARALARRPKSGQCGVIHRTPEDRG